MLSFILQFIAVSLFSWPSWRILRSYFVKTSLDNLPGPPSESFAVGHFIKLFNPKAWDFHAKLAKEYGGVVKVKGPFGENILYVFDPKALHHIVVKDQHIFEETDPWLIGNNIIFGSGLFSTIVPIFYGVSYKLRDVFLRKVKNGPQEIDVLSWLSRTSLELIGQSGLGYTFDPLTEDGNEHPYSISAKLLIPSLSPFNIIRQYLLPTLVKIGTPRFRRFIIDILPWKDLHKLRDIIDVMHNTSVEIFESKKRAIKEGDEALKEEIGLGKDIITILMKANIVAAEEDKLTDSEVIGQMSTFTFAAMDTTSGALTRILHVLAKHPEVQERLRQEICEAREQHGDMGYDQLVALPYLDAVCRETLRLHPPLSHLLRIAHQDTVLPVSHSIQGVDGKFMEDIFVPKGTQVLVSMLASNTNPEIWGSDSHEWKPERWLSSLPETVPNAHLPGIYSHLMTFFGGSRACIGFKFAQLEMKVVLCLLLEKFRFSLPENKTLTWQMTAIVTPRVAGDTERPQLPLVISLVA